MLPVEIKEGPRAQITKLVFTGVGEARLPQIEKAAALTPPAPYVAAEVNEARVRIEEQYRRQGFNDAEVEVEPEIAPDDTVTLTVKVAEGSQQVLRAVELTGNEVTKSKVLTQALRFKIGEPVDLDEWTLARKRLYDTNVFRLVDIQTVPVGEPVDGVQPVKAVVKVEEYPAWSFRYGFQLEGERRAELDEFTSSRNAGVVSELRTPNLFGRALTGGVFGMYQRDQPGRVGICRHLAAVRLVARDRRSIHSSSAIGCATTPATFPRSPINRGSVPINAGAPGVCKSSMATASSVITPSIPTASTIRIPFDFVADLAKLSSAVLFDRRDDPINARKGTFSLDLLRLRVDETRIRRQQPQSARAAVRVRARRPAGAGLESASGVCVRQGSAAVCGSLPRRRRDQRSRIW